MSLRQQLTAPIWRIQLKDYMQSEAFQELDEKVTMLYQTQTVFPEYDYIFHALNLVDYLDVNVCILGQDPYHGKQQAHGLAFSIMPQTRKLQPSLQNIFKELHTDLNVPIASSGDLTKWAQQGVLLLNTVLTVEEGKAGSHRHIGWEQLTDYMIAKLNARQEPIIFVLWGKDALAKRKMIDESVHKVITAPHPSPLSAYRGFFGSRPFSQINEQLQQWGRPTIDWRLE